MQILSKRELFLTSFIWLLQVILVGCAWLPPADEPCGRSTCWRWSVWPSFRIGGRGTPGQGQPSSWPPQGSAEATVTVSVSVWLPLHCPASSSLHPRMVFSKPLHTCLSLSLFPWRVWYLKVNPKPTFRSSFTHGSAGEESPCHCRRYRRRGLDPSVRKIPWRSKWQPTPVFLPEKFLWTEECGRLQSRVSESWTQLSDLVHTHTDTLAHMCVRVHTFRSSKVEFVQVQGLRENNRFYRNSCNFISLLVHLMGSTLFLQQHQQTAAFSDLSLTLEALWILYKKQPIIRLCFLSTCAESLSHVRRFAAPWTLAHQSPLSRGFSRQEYWSGLSFFPPVDLHNPGIKAESPVSPAGQVDSLPSDPSGWFKCYIPNL